MFNQKIISYEKRFIKFSSPDSIVQGCIDTDIPTRAVEQSLLIIKPDADKKFTEENKPVSNLLFLTLLNFCLLFEIELPLIATINMAEYPAADEFLNTHYQEHYLDYTQSHGEKKPWYPQLIRFMKMQEPEYTGFPQFFVMQGPAGKTIPFLREFCLYEFRGEMNRPYSYYTAQAREKLGFTSSEPAFKKYTDPTHNLLHVSANSKEAAHEVANLLDHLSRNVGLEIKHYFEN